MMSTKYDNTIDRPLYGYQVIGYLRIDFQAHYRCPFCLMMLAATAGMWSGGNVVLSQVAKPTAGHVPSICVQDMALEAWAMAKQKNPPDYSIYLYNCNHFAAEAVMVGLQ